MTTKRTEKPRDEKPRATEERRPHATVWRWRPGREERRRKGRRFSPWLSAVVVFELALFGLLGFIAWFSFLWTQQASGADNLPVEAVPAEAVAGSVDRTPPAVEAPAERRSDERRVPEVPAVRGDGPRLPHSLVFPVAGDATLTASFGDPRPGGRSHEGEDVLAAKGTPVRAVADGTVRWMRRRVGGDCCSLSLRHENGWRTRYIHLDNDTPGTDDGRGYGIREDLEVGSRVAAGEVIGWVGDSGNAESKVPHLHFELRRPDGDPIDPHSLLLEAQADDAPGR